MKYVALLALMGAFLLIGGCKPAKPPLTPLGDGAPAFGASGKATLKDFVVGSWCVNDPIQGLDPSRYYNFKADGTFDCGDSTNWTSTGKWTLSREGDDASLSYETMNGKPFEEFRTQYKQAEEGGTQIAVSRGLIFDGVFNELTRLGGIWVDEDKRHLSFSQPQPAAQGESDAAGVANILAVASAKLERMGPKSD